MILGNNITCEGLQCVALSDGSFRVATACRDVGWLIDWLIDWLIIYGFTSRSRIVHLYEDVTIAGEGLQI
jgi:hypothetical protein